MVCLLFGQLKEKTIAISVSTKDGSLAKTMVKLIQKKYSFLEKHENRKDFRNKYCDRNT